MTTESIEEEQEDLPESLDALSMSDEDFLNASPDDFENPLLDASEGASDLSEEAEDTEADALAEADGSDGSEEKTEVTAGADKESIEEVTEDAAQEIAASEETKTESSKEDESKDTDYESQVQKILSPFKANGREIQVDNVDDAINLMQKGANYNKKMQALKPNLKIIKMLENNGLLDEAKISNLIDLEKKNPEAIQKLIKDSGMDPLDIDTEKESEYTPNTYTVDDKEMELDAVLSDLEDSKSFQETLNVISNKFDASSKTVIAENPEVIRVINEHVELGIYSKIIDAVERERVLGRLDGVNDITAYKQVGDAMNAQGAFNDITQAQQVSQKSTEKKSTIQKDKTLKTRKKAASTTQGSGIKKAQPSFNPLAMSDEDFEKETANNKYM